MPNLVSRTRFRLQILGKTQAGIFEPLKIPPTLGLNKGKSYKIVIAMSDELVKKKTTSSVVNIHLHGLRRQEN